MRRSLLSFFVSVFCLSSLAASPALGQFNSSTLSFQPAPLPGSLVIDNNFSTSPAIADFNGDGHADQAVIVGPNSSATLGFVIVLGTGTGAFSLPGAYYSPGYAACTQNETSCANPRVTAADFNNDGKQDILFTMLTSQAGPVGLVNRAALYLGNGDGTFQAPIDVSNYVGASSRVVVTDLRHNGHLDVISQALPDPEFQTPGPIMVALGNGNGTFQTPAELACGANTCGSTFAVGDLGNGSADILYTTTYGFGVMLGNGDGTFRAPVDSPVYVADGVPAMVLGHFTSDHHVGLIISTEVENCEGGSSVLQLLRGNGDGTFASPVTLYSLPCASYFYDLASGDLNGDGIDDVVATGGAILPMFSFATAYTLLSKGSGSFGPATAIELTNSEGAAQTPSFTLADLTGSGNLDMVIPSSPVGLGMLFNTRNHRLVSATAVASNANPETFGQPLQITATVAPLVPPTNGYPSDPPGGVQFFDNGKLLTQRPVLGGVATLDNWIPSVGTHNLSALYSGDGYYYGSRANLLPQIVNGAATTTSIAITSTNNPSIFSNPVSMRATVTGQATVNGKVFLPLGAISFYSEGILLGTRALVNGTATLTSDALAIGADYLSATYQGNAQFAPSTSGYAVQTVNGIATSIVLTSNANPSTLGTSVTFTATISRAAAPDTAQPNGYLHFYDHGAEIGSGFLQSGIASFTTSALATGTHSITARYLSGSSAFAPSTSNTVSQKVN